MNSTTTSTLPNISNIVVDAEDTWAHIRPDLLHQLCLSRYFVGISLTLSLYDWLLLLGQETQTAWKTRWSWSKAIYFNNRVANVVGLVVVGIMTSDLWTKPLSHRFCMFYVWFSLPLEWISFLLGNVILTLRVIALYNRNIHIIRLLYILIILCWTSSFGFTIATLIRISPDISYSPTFHACVTNEPLSLASGIFLGPALFECTIFCLTLFRAIAYARQKALISHIRTPFLSTLYRDGFYYFAAVFAVHIWNVIAYLTQPVKGNYMGTHFAWSVMTVMSSRIYLNLVRAAYGVEEEDETDELRRTTGIDPLSVNGTGRDRNRDQDQDRWTRSAIHLEELTLGDINTLDEQRGTPLFPMTIIDYACKYTGTTNSNV